MNNPVSAVFHQNGFDVYAPVNVNMIQAMKSVGIKYVLRYLSHNPNKNLSLAELKLLTVDNDFKVIVVWEAAGNLYSSFTAAEAQSDAAAVMESLGKLGVTPDQMKDMVVYFAVDFDALEPQIIGGIATYFKTLQTRLGGAPFKIGVYGNGAVCQYMLEHNLAAKAWVMGGSGTNGTKEFVASGKWSIHQAVPSREFGTSVDADEVKDDAGAFTLPSGWKPPLSTITVNSGSSGGNVEKIQQALNMKGTHPPLVIDGSYGPSTMAAVKIFQSQHALPPTGNVDPYTQLALCISLT